MATKYSVNTRCEDTAPWLKTQENNTNTFIMSVFSQYKKWGRLSAAQWDIVEDIRQKSSLSDDGKSYAPTRHDTRPLVSSRQDRTAMPKSWKKLAPMFLLAGTTLKKPATRIGIRGKRYILKCYRFSDGDLYLTLAVIGGHGRRGSLFVCNMSKGYINWRTPHDRQIYQNAVTLFAADPVAMSKAYADEFEECGYCGRGLTDPRSTSHGYGPVCAKNYGLPWGHKDDQK